MIDPRYLELLRCPLDPQRDAKITIEDETKVFCTRCRLQFGTRERIQNFIVEEAILPPGIVYFGQLSCHQNCEEDVGFQIERG